MWKNRFFGIHTLDNDVFVRKITNFSHACLYGEIKLFRRSHLPTFTLLVEIKLLRNQKTSIYSRGLRCRFQDLDLGASAGTFTGFPDGFKTSLYLSTQSLSALEF